MSIESEKISYDEDRDYHQRLTLPYWVPTNRKNFTEFIKNNFAPAFNDKIERDGLLTKSNYIHETVCTLQQPQQLVAEYLQDGSPYRGILLYHGLGSGKSAASLAITEGMPDRRAIILLPASLRGNYLKEIETFSTVHLETDYEWVYLKIPGLTSPHDLIESDPSSPAGAIFQQLDTGLGLDRELIPKMLTQRSVRSGSKKLTEYGIWLIEPDESAGGTHFDDLDEGHQKEVRGMLRTAFDYKYQFIHYNAGQTLFKSAFEQVSDRDKDMIRESVNKVSTQAYGSWKSLRINKSNKDAVLSLISDQKIENPFNNKVIVVDEIHNMVSRIIGGGYTGKVLYPLLLTATNAKIIFLSGTPAINSPYELGILFNMLSGSQKTYQFRLKDNNHPNRKQVAKLLGNHSNVDFYSVGDDGRVIITQNYHSFINAYTEAGTYLGVTRGEDEYLNPEHFLESVISSFPKEIIIKRSKKPPTYHAPFPSFTVGTDVAKQMVRSKEEFYNNYVDFTNHEPKRTDIFKSKIVGMVSFFNETTRKDATGHSVFPSKVEDDPEKIPLSNYQFIKYSQARIQERELEVKSSNKGKSSTGSDVSFDDGKSISYFKVISRNSQLFVFPPNLERLWPKDIRKRLEIERGLLENLNPDTEVDDDTGAQVLEYEDGSSVVQEGGAASASRAETTRLASEQYLAIKDSLLDGLTPDNLHLRSQSPYNLSVLSPKYVEIFTKICLSPGPSLCYSQFRTVEGIEVFTRVLGENGYQSYRVGSEPSDYQLQVGSRVRYMISPDVFTTLEVRELYGDRIGVAELELRDNLRHIYQENGYSGSESERKTNEVVFKLGLASDPVVLSDKPPSLSRSKSETTSDRTKSEILKRRPSSRFGGATSSTSDKLLYLPRAGPDGSTLTYPATYAIWTSEQGQQLLDTFNDPSNKYGQNITVIFITMAGAEGISLYNVRQVHVMEPFWNKVKIDQVIGRARRIGSHSNLPPGNEQGRNNQRKVHVYQYLGVFTEAQRTGKWGDFLVGHDNTDVYNSVLGDKIEGLDKDKPADLEKIKQQFQALISEFSVDVDSGDKGLTSDESLYDISLNKAKIVDGFLKLVQESAMDCTIHRKENKLSNPLLAKLQCLDTETLGSEGSYIQVPGQILESATRQDKLGVKQTRTLGLFKINNKAGIFDIAAIIDGKTKIVYNLYTYYGLDPRLGWTVASKERSLEPIGTVIVQDAGLTGNLFVEFAGPDNHANLQVYDAVEAIRRKVVPERGLPTPGKDEDEWRRSIREAYRSVHDTVTKDSEVATMVPGDEGMIPLETYVGRLNLTTWPVTATQLLAAFNSAKGTSASPDQLAEIKKAYGYLRKLLRKKGPAKK